MHIRQSLIFLTFALTLSRCICPSPSNEIRKSFEKVDQALERSNQIINKQIEKLYNEIKSNPKKNDLLINKADSVYFSGYEAFKQIDKVKESLRLADSIGNDLNSSEDLLLKSPAGDSLYIHRTRIHRLSLNALTDSAKIEQVNSMCADVITSESIASWKEKYFKSTPTIAALAILSKFQNDCINAVTLSLEDIKDQLSRQ